MSLSNITCTNESWVTTSVFIRIYSIRLDNQIRNMCNYPAHLPCDGYQGKQSHVLCNTESPSLQNHTAGTAVRRLLSRLRLDLSLHRSQFSSRGSNFRYICYEAVGDSVERHSRNRIRVFPLYTKLAVLASRSSSPNAWLQLCERD